MGPAREGADRPCTMTDRFPDAPPKSLLVGVGDAGEIVQVGDAYRVEHPDLPRRIQRAPCRGLSRGRDRPVLEGGRASWHAAVPKARCAIDAISAHPNDFDRKRIERALKARKRYRYVTPRVAAVTDGYRIESPCCSRNIDPDGGVVDVALLLYRRGRREMAAVPKGSQERHVGVSQQL